MMRRRKKFSLLAVLALFAVGLGVWMSFSVCQKNLEIQVSSWQQPQKQQIVLDPGHGGMDGGAVGKQNIVEKDINLAIALKLKTLLEISGFEVYMTRSEDVSIHDPGVSGTKAQKTSDMHNRLKLIEEHPHALFVSIHQNKFQESKYHGAQIFYSPNLPESELLADTLQKSFKELLQPDNNREHKKAGSELYLLYNAQVPAVLVECGFLSNPEEAVKLTQPVYQDQVAFTILKALLEFCGENTLEYQKTFSADYPYTL